jgi:hypothetical protein
VPRKKTSTYRALSTTRVVMRICMVILPCASCSTHPPAQPEPQIGSTSELKTTDASRPKANKATRSRSGCQSDADCLLNPIDCTTCGHCQGDDPLAISRAQLDELREECERHPPARLNPNAARLRLAYPACSPCPEPPEDYPIWKARCREGTCIAEQIGTQKRRPLDGNIPLKSSP